MSAEEEPAEDTEDEPVYPFYQVSGSMLNGSTVRAGWMTESGDIDYLVMDMTDVGVNRVGQAFELAFGWYADRLNVIAERSAVEPAADEVEAEGQ